MKKLHIIAIAICLFLFFIPDSFGKMYKWAGAGDSSKIDWQTATEMVKKLPCKKGGTVDEYLTKKAGVPAVEDLDWHTYPRDDGFEVERLLLLDNRLKLQYKWHVSFDGHIRAINGKAMGITE